MPAVAGRQSAVVDGNGESGHPAGQPTNSGGQTMRKITEQWRATPSPQLSRLLGFVQSFLAATRRAKLSKWARAAAWYLVEA